MTFANATGIVSYGYSYNEKNQLVRENISVGTGDAALNRCLERSYDQFGRPIGYQLKNGDQVEQSLSYTYNTAGQVARITADGKQFDYQYVEKAPSLISGMTSPVHTVSNTYDEKQSTLSNKTNSWKNKIDSPTISSYTYTVNSFGQRTSVSTEGEAFANAPAPWVWNYDVLGQVIKANNYDYSYDSIGNRKTTGKDDAILANYQSNNLNQYTAVNTNAPSYDNEGNLLSGLTPTSALPDRSNLNFVYNAENRPISVSRNGEVLESYEYDHMGRRVRKGNTITIYDGFNAIAEYDLSSKSLKETYSWGLDLSGSIQNAGGVGGLLSVTDYSTQTPLTSYSTYDGNGNISEYLTEQSSNSGNSSLRADNQELGLITAHYEYDAFGSVIKKTGSGEYRYQFSTKPFDSITGLNYYNYRLYDPVLGRWINRDPIEEQGGLNLYNFVGNDGVYKVDFLGKQPTLSIGFNSKVILGPCGLFIWMISWSIDAVSDERNGGYILQDVTAVADIKHCNGKDKIVGESKYSEVWRVDPGTRNIFGGGFDMFEIKEEQDCARGTFKISGIARYYPNQGEVGKGDDGWVVKETSPAGKLPINPNNPNWDKTGASNVVKHSISVSWDCCKSKSVTKIESQTPVNNS